MITYAVRDQKGFSPNLSGATWGASHIEPLLLQLDQNLSAPGEIVVFDMTGIETATASYLKATFVKLLRRAGAIGESTLGDQTSPSENILDIFPVISGLSIDVREELDEVLTPRKLACLEVIEIAQNRIVKAQLRGMRDGVVATTLEALTHEGQATATQLHENYGHNINITGWNNRLFDLHQLRLARRSKQNRQWVYEPIAAEVIEEVFCG